MNSTVAIHAEGLSKQYRIGSRRDSYSTLRETIMEAVQAPFKRASSLLRGEAYGAAGLKETIWALKDVSFEVSQGEVVGIIGRNGAGKSTLLKILSRITEPSEGFAEVRGRVGSLLEVGTGFHPELTGRENIYLNGAILGMHRYEIERKFDEMVAFAEVEKFIDTPVKHYSSGMYLRLAFAVAAHLEPEILLVDEVLAVGDIKFQEKCLGKMNEVATEGRTVLFVSHNMAAARQLCQTGIVLEHGRVAHQGTIDSAIAYYTQENNPVSTASFVDTRQVTNRSGIGGGRIVSVAFANGAGLPDTLFGIGEPFSVTMNIELEQSLDVSLEAGVEIRKLDGTQLVNLRSDSESTLFPLEGGEKQIAIRVHVAGLPLYPGIYVVEPWFCQRQGRRVDHVHNACFITMETRGVFASERFIQPNRGVLLANSRWEKAAFEPVDTAAASRVEAQ